MLGCPRRAVPPDVWEALPVLEMAERQILPVAGGSLDQAASFLDLYGCYLSVLSSLNVQTYGR